MGMTEEKKIQIWECRFSGGGVTEGRIRRGYVKDGLLYCTNEFYADFEVEEIINLAHPRCEGAELSKEKFDD